ncbi:UNVERIFIED_CONTAM: hypothetical protein Sangu_2125300 [Sesamum angustifolium]|uniref:Zinc knuckle CX2CX4HX4C domain-containing protein n=1 Tax=Sesamum angustifolium TaxID=2727405 RepID=A0AAW2LFD8_9LAMI
MDSGLNGLKSALSLTELEDAGVVIASSLWYSDSDSYDLYLVGRILSSRAFHADALKSTLLLAFNPVRGMDLKPLEGNRLLLKFNHIVDRNRVLDSAGHVWGSHMRIWASVDVTKPLRRVLKLQTTLGDEQLLYFTYEKLPNFCYLCGCLGHLSKFCELRFSEDFVDPGDATPFGPWLRATNIPTGRNCNAVGNRILPTPLFHLPPHKFHSKPAPGPSRVLFLAGLLYSVLFPPMLPHRPLSSHNLYISPLAQLKILAPPSPIQKFIRRYPLL